MTVCWNVGLGLSLVGLGAGLSIGWASGDLETARLILLAGASGVLAPLLAGWRRR